MMIRPAAKLLAAALCALAAAAAGAAEPVDINEAVKLTLKDNSALRSLRQELIKRAEAEAGTFAYTPAQREAYINEGGAPHLDGAYTVFGEVLSGMDTIERIENAATDQGDRPVDDIRIISMKVVK